MELNCNLKCLKNNLSFYQWKDSASGQVKMIAYILMTYFYVYGKVPFHSRNFFARTNFVKTWNIFTNASVSLAIRIQFFFACTSAYVNCSAAWQVTLMLSSICKSMHKSSLPSPSSSVLSLLMQLWITDLKCMIMHKLKRFSNEQYNK